MPLAYNIIQKQTLTQVFSCEFCEIFKNTFFIEHLRATASELGFIQKLNKLTGCFLWPKYPQG